MQPLAAVRKLLHTIHAMLKKHQPYDGSQLFRASSISAQEVRRGVAACPTSKRKNARRGKSIPPHLF
jgi:hypothetical protein